VAGGEPADIAAAIEQSVAVPADPPLWAVPGGLATLRAEHGAVAGAAEDVRWATTKAEEVTQRLATVEGELADHVAALADQRAATELVRDELSAALLALDEKDDRIGLAFAELTAAVRQLAEARSETAHVTGVLAETRAELAAARERLAAVERTWSVRAWWPVRARIAGRWDLLRAHPSEAADEILRRQVPTGRFARYRAAVARSRDVRLYFDVPVPAMTGPDLEVAGWVAHPDMPVSEVWLLVDGDAHPMELGGHRPDVTVALRRDGVAVGEHSGVRVTVPVTGPVQVGLRVRLADGTVLERQLGAVESADED
jgi:hypothetical protein